MKSSKFTKKFLVAILIGLALGFFITIITPIKYKVVSEFELSNLEAEEFVLLAKNTIYDLDFINSVQDDFPTSYDFFARDNDGLKRDWKKVVRVSYDLKTKHVEIAVLYDNLENTIKLSKAITSQFKSKFSEAKVIRDSEANSRIASPDVRKIIPISMAVVIAVFLVIEYSIKRRGRLEKRKDELVKKDNYNARTSNWLNDKR